jgi:hypothetical protein
MAFLVEFGDDQDRGHQLVMTTNALGCSAAVAAAPVTYSH